MCVTLRFSFVTRRRSHTYPSVIEGAGGAPRWEKLPIWAPRRRSQGSGRPLGAALRSLDLFCRPTRAPSPSLGAFGGRRESYLFQKGIAGPLGAFQRRRFGRLWGSAYLLCLSQGMGKAMDWAPNPLGALIIIVTETYTHYRYINEVFSFWYTQWKFFLYLSRYDLWSVPSGQR